MVKLLWKLRFWGQNVSKICFFKLEICQHFSIWRYKKVEILSFKVKMLVLITFFYLNGKIIVKIEGLRPKSVENLLF